MSETALVLSQPAGTAPTVPVRPAAEHEAMIITGPWAAVTNESALPPATPGWLSRDAYEAILNGLVAENTARGGIWTPDTPEQAADRAAIAQALLDKQLAIITRDDD